MTKIHSFAASSRSIEALLSSTLNVDYQEDFASLKKVVSDPFEAGQYEIELFRPLPTENDNQPNSALSRKGLLKRYSLGDWRFGTIEHLVSLAETDKTDLICETKGVPVVALGSYDPQENCPVIHTAFFPNGDLLLDLENGWFFETMPYFLRLRRI